MRRRNPQAQIRKKGPGAVGFRVSPEPMSSSLAEGMSTAVPASGCLSDLRDFGDFTSAL
jgi:hypothetical protein